MGCILDNKLPKSSMGYILNNKLPKSSWATFQTTNYQNLHGLHSRQQITKIFMGYILDNKLPTSSMGYILNKLPKSSWATFQTTNYQNLHELHSRQQITKSFLNSNGQQEITSHLIANYISTSRISLGQVKPDYKIDMCCFLSKHAIRIQFPWLRIGRICQSVATQLNNSTKHVGIVETSSSH